MLPQKLSFSSLQRRQIEAEFSGGHITSDAGVLLLRELDKRHSISADLANSLVDERDQHRVRHSALSQIQQRLYGLACGYEDLNDHDQLRDDYAFQLAVNRIEPLASKALERWNKPLIAQWLSQHTRHYGNDLWRRTANHPNDSFWTSMRRTSKSTANKRPFLPWLL